MDSDRARFLIADDHPLYREALRQRLERTVTGADVVETEDFGAAIAALDGDVGDFTLAFIDLAMPGMAGAASVARLVAVAPRTPVVIMSGQADHDVVLASVRAGARGYLPKTLPTDHLAHIVAVLRAGGTYLPAEIIGTAAEPIDAAPVGEDPRVADVGKGDDLTRREREVLAHLATGLSNKEIARIADIAEITVKLHVRNILRKLGARNRAEASVIAHRAGLL
jgi:DNA-binding NarL/FixJ family response regulator